MVKFTKKVGEYNTVLAPPGKSRVSKKWVLANAPEAYALVDHYADTIDFYIAKGQHYARYMPQLRELNLTHQQKIWRRWMRLCFLEYHNLNFEDKLAFKNTVVNSDAHWRDTYTEDYFFIITDYYLRPNLPSISAWDFTQDSIYVTFRTQEPCYMDLFYLPGQDYSKGDPMNWYLQGFTHRGLRGSGRVREGLFWKYAEASPLPWGVHHSFWILNITEDFYPFYFSVQTYNSVPVPWGVSGVYCIGRYRYITSPWTWDLIDVNTNGFTPLTGAANYPGFVLDRVPMPPLEPNVWES